jgi:hypothetical protein
MNVIIRMVYYVELNRLNLMYLMIKQFVIVYLYIVFDYFKAFNKLVFFRYRFLEVLI